MIHISSSSFDLILSDLNEDLPMLDVTGVAASGQVEMTLSTECGCVDDDICFNTSVLLFNRAYTNLITRIAAIRDAAGQCQSSNDLTVATISCN